MQLTAAVINAGLGDLSLGLERAGFQVVAAYEMEEKAVKIHQFNLETPVYKMPLEELSLESFPKVDLLAAHIYGPAFSIAGRDKKSKYEDDLWYYREILEQQRPRAFFFLFNIAFMKSERCRHLLEDVIPSEYKLSWSLSDVAQTIGFPVKESLAYVVGTANDTEKFKFPVVNKFRDEPLSSFLEYDQHVDSWYYQIKLRDDRLYEDKHDIYCWKNHAYVGTDYIQWNYLKIPLIRDWGTLRKLTHREVANLKGFPKEYEFPCQDRQWLYKKLIYSGNVVLIQQIASLLNYILSSNPWRDQKKERGYHFEKIFGSYLEKIKEQVTDNCSVIDTDILVAGYLFDFKLQKGNHTFYFEVKNSFNSKTKEICTKLADLKENGIIILVVANEVAKNIKQEYLEVYGIYIWDVTNLLWIFEEFPDIKNEFVAYLEYSTEQIIPESPEPGMFWEFSESSKKEPDLKEKLIKITPGQKYFREYEDACVEILKYILGDYLTLWEIQEPSNDGLYRFDLCCKIKSGVNQDFFDTIKNYFNTKYIVFEFKNCQKKITQKEIYTTEKYLYEKALRKAAIIISRQGADDNALKAAKGSLREHGKLILCLSDNSLLDMIDIKMQGEQEPADFLSAILDDILVHLEK